MTMPIWIFYVALAVFLVAILIQIYFVMKDTKNQIDWSQFISSVGRDGKERADLTKLGQVVGIILVSWIVVTLSYRVKDVDILGFWSVLALALAYLGGVQAYQAYLKSKRQKEENVGSSERPT